MSNSFKEVTIGIISIIVGYTCFSFGDAMIKHLGTQYSAIQTVFMIMFLIMFLSLLTSKFFGGIKPIIKTEHKKKHVVRGLTFAFGFVLFAHALQSIVMVKAYTLLLTMPFFSAALAIPLLKEKVSLKRWITILMAFSGALIVLRPGYIAVDLASIGVIVSAILFSLYDIQTRNIGKKEAQSAFIFYPAVISAVVLGGILIFQGDIFLPTITVLGLFFIIASIHLVGHFFTIKGYTHAPMSIAAPFQYIQIVWAFIFGSLIFDDTVDIWTITGCAILIGSGLVLVHQRNS